MELYTIIEVIIYFILSFPTVGHANEVLDSILTIEIYADGEIKRIDFQSEDIERIGINERGLVTQLEITFASRFHSIIEKLTGENKGKRADLRTGGETIYSGIICLERVSGIGPKVAQAIVTFFGSLANHDILSKLREAGVRI